MNRVVTSPTDNADPATNEKPSGMATVLRQWLSDAWGVLEDQLYLLGLEAKRAAQALGFIAALGIAAGILIACTWLGLSAALALWLIEKGMQASVAVLAASLVDLVGTLLCMATILRASSALTFPATRKSLLSAERIDQATP